MRALLSFSENLYQLFIQNVERIKKEETSDLKQSEKLIPLCLEYLKQLRALIMGFKKVRKVDEIHFFKVIKPQFVSQYLFYVKIFKLHTFWPMGNEQVYRNYLQNELYWINQFFERNKSFYSYYRTNSTYMDHAYFIRNQPVVEPFMYQYLFESDSIFNTPGDLLVAKIIANNHFQEYLIKQLALLAANELFKTPETVASSSLTWTESKSALVELVYALHVCRVFNEGNADIKTIAAALEKAFHIELTDTYDLYLHIKRRKIEPTKFLNRLINGLKKDLSEPD